MSYVKPAVVDRLILPSDSAFWVEMKTRASYGDVEDARSAMLKLSTGPSGVISQMEWKAYIQTLTARLITDWNLTDENDHPLPITPSSLDFLDAQDGDLLVTEAQKRATVRSEVQEIPFESRSTN